MAERVAHLETWQQQHEQRCDDRQVAMGREIRDMKDAVGGLTKVAWAVVIAFAGWAALQIYANLQSPHTMPAPAATATFPQP